MTTWAQFENEGRDFAAMVRARCQGELVVRVLRARGLRIVTTDCLLDTAGRELYVILTS